MKYLAFLTIAVFVFASQSCYYDNEEELYQFLNTTDCDTTNISYTNHVVPTLNQYCMNCHSASTAASFGANINLSTYDQTKIYADNGSLYGSITFTSGYSSMPKNAAQMPQCDLDIIKAWIDAGTPNN